MLLQDQTSKNQSIVPGQQRKENRLKILSFHGKLAPRRLTEATVSRHPARASGTTYKRRGARAGLQLTENQMMTAPAKITLARITACRLL